jgi:hypothetical protein
MAPIVLSDTTLAERLLLTGEANMANEDQEQIDSNFAAKVQDAPSAENGTSTTF